MTTTPIRRRQYKTEPVETMDESGAHILRTKIERAWLERGVLVRVWVERMPWIRNCGEGWVVRSDLLGGMPPATEISSPISRSAGHPPSAEDGQMARAALRETPFAGEKGQIRRADKATFILPSIPANPSNEGPQSP